MNSFLSGPPEFHVRPAINPRNGERRRGVHVHPTNKQNPGGRERQSHRPRSVSSLLILLRAMVYDICVVRGKRRGERLLSQGEKSDEAVKKLQHTGTASVKLEV